MKDLLITSNKTETVINVVSFVIGCTLIATLCAAIIYGILNGSLWFFTCYLRYSLERWKYLQDVRKRIIRIIIRNVKN